MELMKEQRFGFGCMRLPVKEASDQTTFDYEKIEELFDRFLEAGFSYFDTAYTYHGYQAEKAVKKALVDRYPRERFQLATKMPLRDFKDEEDLEKIFAEQLENCGVDYFDFLLIHQPFGDYYGTWRAMEEAYKTGKVRAIGVSNFYPDRLIDICSFAEVAPMVNQVETHVLHQQEKAHNVMEKYGVRHEAWSPFAEGKKDFFANPVLAEIASRHEKAVAQIALRFLIQRGIIVIPKSARKERMQENYNVFDFVLDDGDMQKLSGLDEKESAFFSHYDPETVEYIIGLCK